MGENKDPLQKKQELINQYQKRKPIKVKTVEEMGLVFEESTFDYFRDYDFTEVCYSDFDYTPEPKSVFKISPFNITEIQYLRGLIYNDQLVNDYKNAGDKAIIDQKTTMYGFTEKLLKLLDEFEEGMSQG